MDEKHRKTQTTAPSIVHYLNKHQAANLNFLFLIYLISNNYVLIVINKYVLHNYI
jgi:hypothetical protein